MTLPAVRPGRVSDAELAARVRGSNTLLALSAGEAAEELWRRYVDGVRRWMSRRLGDFHLTEDLVSEAFLGAVRSFPEEVRSTRLTFGWWWRERAHMLHRRIRRRAAIIHEVSADLLPERTAVSDESGMERRELIAEALAQLPHRSSRVLCWYYIEGYSVEELSRVEGISPATAKVTLHRARRKFREAYSEIARSSSVF